MADLLERLKTALSDRYEIESEIGRGGMAVVFVAEDVRHHRKVALKVLHPQLSVTLATDRFLNEIQIVAGLEHPHILTLIDSGDADGLLYYIMPYVAGESLRQRLERDGQLPVEESVRIAVEVADGLDFAHRQGVIHRDVKPGNVLLSDRHAVITDFGIARAITVAQGERVTSTGLGVGTPLYASPEQATGAETLDGRTDIFSLGCVLYEMLSGEVPLAASTPVAVHARRMSETPGPIHLMRDTVSPLLDDVIGKALARLPADRFETAEEFASALVTATMDTTPVARWDLSAAPVSRPRPKRRTSMMVGLTALAAIAAGAGAWTLWDRSSEQSGAYGSTGLDPAKVAVLYFEDLSPAVDNEVVAYGLTAGLIEQLSYVRRLKVISLSGVEPYRDRSASRDSIARALQVGTIIDGSIEAVGDRLRVTVRLVEGFSGSDIERLTFEVPAGEVLLAKDSVAGSVSRQLRHRLGGEIDLRETMAQTESVEAWSFVQRASRLVKDADAEGDAGDFDGALSKLAIADSIFDLAEGADPDWVRPISRRAHGAFVAAYISALGKVDYGLAEEHIAVGIAHADRALALEARNADALEQRFFRGFWRQPSDLAPPWNQAALYSLACLTLFLADGEPIHSAFVVREGPLGGCTAPTELSGTKGTPPGQRGATGGGAAGVSGCPECLYSWPMCT